MLLMWLAISAVLFRRPILHHQLAPCGVSPQTRLEIEHVFCASHAADLIHCHCIHLVRFTKSLCHAGCGEGHNLFLGTHVGASSHRLYSTVQHDNLVHTSCTLSVEVSRSVVWVTNFCVYPDDTSADKDCNRDNICKLCDCVQVDSPAGSITEALMKAASNPMQAELLSEHRRIQKGRKELQFQVYPTFCLLALLQHPLCCSENAFV